MNLTKPQRLVYDMDKFSGGAISVICGSMLVCGKRDISEIKKTVNDIYRLNDALRIRISEQDGEASQSIREYVERDVPVLCFDDKAELDHYAESYAKVAVDLYGDLCESKIVVLPEQYGLLVKMHHIVGDAWTLALMGTQFNALLNGEDVQSYSYTEYVESEKSYVEGKRYAKDRDFFLEQFKKCDEVTYLNEKQTSSLSANRKTFVIDAEQTQALNSYAEANNTSVFMLFTAALATYMNRTKMNAERFYIGTAVLNRIGAKEKNTMGMFINTVPMLIELDNGKSFAENLSVIEETAISVFRHQKYNYGDVLATIRKEYNFTEKLYDVMISYQNATVAGEDIETTWYHCGEQSESLQIHIDDRDHEGVFSIHYDYLTEKITEHEIDRLHEHICNLLFDAVKDSTKKLYELDLLFADEKQNLLYDFNDTAMEYPKDKCVHELFEDQVAQTPDKLAVIACDKTLTYRELNEQANRIANALIAKGVHVGDIVAFTLPRRSYLIAAMFGILKAGAAYLPIDPAYPQDRIDYMLSDSDAKFLIHESNIADLLNNDHSVNLTIRTECSTPCYCIYTSGSTGQPKGVVINHKNLANFCSDNTANNLQFYIAQNCNTVLACGSITFDISNFEIALSLLLKKTVVLANEDALSDITALGNILESNTIDCVHCTPTKLHTYLENHEFARAFRNVKCVMVGGEILTDDVVAAIQKHCNAEIFNGYGPTETTMGVGFGEVRQYGITIGKPIANTQIYIVDKYMQPTPIGVTGELCIAGDGVGAGYLNRPELTAEKFIDNPFGEGKLYKTGDLAYWREDGNIAYVGRNDFQVKIRGLRIELGEIENAICGMDGISQAVVVVRKNNEGRQLICAFYTGAEVDAKEIRAHIGQKLPKYMLPHIFTHLDEMPLTTSGKVNRKALPEVDLYAIHTITEYSAPKTHLQKVLCQLMSDVLGYSPVGMDDNFFDIGCDSLKSIEFVSKAHNEGIYFNLQNVFDYPTVKQLCDCIENGDKQEVSFADVDFSEVNKLLAQNTVENMTAPQKCEVGNILLAGATGYLGIHILADYLENDNGTAYCLVRGKDKEDCTKRLKDLLDFYFGGKHADFKRVEVICADLQKDKFGLSDEEYTSLLDKVDMVINAAASVKHYGSYKYFYEANVETTKRLIVFCREANAKLIHTSTLSVSGNSFGDQFDGYVSDTEKHFYESSLYIGQPLDNVYARSKFEAEKAVLDAVVDGLEASIMRMGNLTNRLSDGVFQKNHESNAFLQRVKGVLELGIFPDYLMDLYAEFTPIDEAANAVMTIARHFDPRYTVFHINSTKVVYFDKLFEIFDGLGHHVDVVNSAFFTVALRETAQQTKTEHIFETFINDMDENDKLNYDSNIRIDNDFTVQYLKSLGFEWTGIGMDYLKKYMDYFKRIGYIAQ